MSLTKGTVQYVTPSHTFILQIFPPPPPPHFSNPHHRNPFFKIFVHPRKPFILSALPADVNRKGKSTRPLCFLLLIFQPCLFGPIYARFFLSAALLTHVSSPFPSLLKQALFPVFCSGSCSFPLRLPLSQIRPTRACFTFSRYFLALGRKIERRGKLTRHVAKQLFSAQKNKRPQPPVSYLLCRQLRISIINFAPSTNPCLKRSSCSIPSTVIRADSCKS